MNLIKCAPNFGEAQQSTKHARARVSDREQILFMGRPCRALKIAPILHPFGEPNPADIFYITKWLAVFIVNSWAYLWSLVRTSPMPAVYQALTTAPNIKSVDWAALDESRTPRSSEWIRGLGALRLIALVVEA
jgi:hypothetical protein